LIIRNRYGSFPGMLSDRKFNIVIVAKNKVVRTNIDEESDKVVNYNGGKVVNYDKIVSHFINNK
jgi:hypothetical protein